MSARELLHWSPYLNLCPEGSILMLKKQVLGINPYLANNGSRDQSLTGIGGPRVYVGFQVKCGQKKIFAFLIDSSGEVWTQV